MSKGNIRTGYRLGETHINCQKLQMKIIKYVNNKNCDIAFEDGTIVCNREYRDIVKGAVKNLNSPSVLNVGYVGEGRFSTKEGNKHTCVYKTWRGMFERCYSEVYQKKQATYIGCYVDERWHNFQVFAGWFEDNYNTITMEGWQLDKDILIKGNKKYSPETCCFVPREINTIFSKKSLSKKGLPKGVLKSSGKYISRISKNGNRENIGSYNTAQEAFQAYKIAKENYIKELASKHKINISETLFNILIDYKVENG